MPPRKRYRNISGLRNQGGKHQAQPPSSPEGAPVALQEDTESDDGVQTQSASKISHGRRVFFRASFGVDCGDDELEDVDMNDLNDSESDSDSDLDDAYDPDPFLNRNDVQERLLQWAKEHDDDPRDEDWVPPWLKRQQRKQTPTARPKTYATGPDIARKSDRSKRRYREAMKNQKALDAFGYSLSPSPSPMPSSSAQSAVSTPKSEPLEIEVPPPSPPQASDINSQMRQSSVLMRQESVNIEILPHIRQESVDIEIPPLIRQESVDVELPPDPSALDTPEDCMEDIVSETVRGGVEIWPWDVLREQIKDDLKKGAKSLPLSKLNKLMILRNFATLRLKHVRVYGGPEPQGRKRHQIMM